MISRHSGSFPGPRRVSVDAAKSYWANLSGRRVGRRRALLAGGRAGAGLVALAVAGCGPGGETVASSPEEAASLLAKPVDRSKEAVAGGVFQSFESNDIQGFDPNGGSSARSQLVAAYCYLRLLKNKTSFTGTRTEEREGDTAERWEFSPDGLKLTFKLRPGVFWDRRAPTNGRPVDAEDVRFSADRFLALNQYAANFFYSKSASAAIFGIEVPDARTVVMKLAFPYVPLLATFSRALNLWILPRESDGKFDPRTDVRGAGPWTLASYAASSAIEFTRNPDFYVKDRPYLAGWNSSIVPEYPAQLAQFRAGNIWSSVAKQEDILPLKQEIPELQMFQGDYGTGTPCLFFGFQGPFKDQRLRQAMSYLVDRQLFADTLANTASFEAAGLPRGIRINSHIGAGWEGYWLDPFGRDFGPNAKYFGHDAAEARKLLSAAGVSGRLSAPFFYPHNGYGALYQQMVQILAGMLNDTGLVDVRLTPLDYQSEYVPNIHFGGTRIGAWDGLALAPTAQGDDAGHQLLVQYHSKGAASRQPPGVDPRLDQMIDAQIRESDSRKRMAMIQDIQRYMPTTMIAVPISYQAAGFSLNWPWVGNAGAVRGGLVPSEEVYPYLWFDKPVYDRWKA